MKRFFLFFLFIQFVSSCAQESSQTVSKKLQIDYSIKQNKSNKVKTIIDALEVLYNSSYKNYKEYWIDDDFVKLKEPFRDLYFAFNSGYLDYEPTVISVYKNENNIYKESYTVKIAIIGNPEGFNSLYQIYDLGVVFLDNKPKFRNLFLDNLKNYKIKKVSNISYYLKKGINKNQIKQQVKFDNYISNFLHKDKLEYDFFVCSSFKEILKLQSFDYFDNMYFHNSAGGMAWGKESIVFSGGDSFYYPHEVVHLYMSKHYPNRHDVLDEGMATFLGGSLGLSYEELLKELREEVHKSNINLFDYAFDVNLRGRFLKNGTPVFYIVGALICDLAYKEKGIEGLEKLISIGYKNEEKLILEMGKTFQVDKNDLDVFLKEKL